MRKLDTLFTHRRGAAFKESKLTNIARKSLGRLEQIRKPTKQTFGAYKQTLADGSRVKSYTFGSKYGTLDLVRMYRPPARPQEVCPYPIYDRIKDASDPAQVAITLFADIFAPEFLGAWGAMDKQYFRQRGYGSVYPGYSDYEDTSNIYTYDVCSGLIDTTEFVYNWGFYAYKYGSTWIPVPGTNLMWSEHCITDVTLPENQGLTCAHRDADGLKRTLSILPPPGDSSTVTNFDEWGVAATDLYITKGPYNDTQSGYNLVEIDGIIWAQTKYLPNGVEGYQQAYWLEGRRITGGPAGSRTEIRTNLFRDVYYDPKYGPWDDYFEERFQPITCLEAGGLHKDPLDNAIIATRFDSWVVPGVTLAYTADLINPTTGAILNSGSQPRYIVPLDMASWLSAGGILSRNLFVPYQDYNDPLTMGIHIFQQPSSWFSGENLTVNRILPIADYTSTPLNYFRDGALTLYDQNRIGFMIQTQELNHNRILLFNMQDLA